MFEKEATEYATEWGDKTDGAYACCRDGYLAGAEFGYNKAIERLSKAKEIILKLYNAGRDVLMCRAEEKVYDNLSEAINDRIIDKFLQEVEND